MKKSIKNVIHLFKNNPIISRMLMVLLKMLEKMIVKKLGNTLNF